MIVNKLSEWTDWLYENAKWVFLVMLAMCCAAITILIVFAYSGQKDISRLSKATAVLQLRDAKLTRENAQRIQDIQDEREESVLRGCLRSNERHDNGFRVLDKLYKGAEEAATSDAEKKRIAASKKASQGLIQALVPKRDCEAYVKATVPSGASNTPIPNTKEDAD